MTNFYISRSLSNLLKGLCLLVLIVFSFSANAQTPNRPNNNPPPPLSLREISGIVKDTTDTGIPGVTIRLTSDKDTLVVSTNPDGIFVFKNVKAATYTLSLTMMSYQPLIAKFKQNDAVARVVMDPIILKSKANTLDEVVINGTPSITYKTDTVEYKASDYIVRKNATVDELLKKMEGMEVGTDGSLIHQGQAVTKAKLNGKEYLGGDLANAIKNLPAEIVEKIQIVDDYGEKAARTGIKEGDPEKVLNITTRLDKSVGNTLNLNAAGGNNERYETGVFGTRINGNQVIGLNGKFNNTINGVAGSGSNGSGGTTNTKNGSFSYRDKLNDKWKFNFNYGFTSNDVNSLNSSFSKDVSIVDNKIDSTFSTKGSSSDNNSINHNIRLELEADLNKNNYLRIQPSFSFSSSENMRLDSTYQIGFRHQNQLSNNTNSNASPKLGISIFYLHLFAKPKRNFSISADLNNNNQDAERLQDSRILFYLNDAETLTKDSLVNRIVARENLQRNYKGAFTYVEPTSVNSQIEVNAQINYNGYTNTATTRNLDAFGASKVIDSLSNIYDYSFTQGRIGVNYRYGLSNTSKIRMSIGLTAVPALLKGTKVSLGTSTERNSFNLIPIARFEYLFSKQHKIAVNYSGNAVEPTFDQIQPVRDVTNPQNPIIGNADLKATFVHTVRADYNNYIANAKLNYSINSNFSFTDNAVIRNNTQVKDPNVILVPGAKPVYITETRFTNTDGVYRLNANYSVSKQLSDRKYNLALSGSVNYDHRLSMTKGLTNVNVVQTYIERFGPRINPTEWFEINPNISHNYTKSENSLLTNETHQSTLALNVDGKVYLWKTYIFGYNASKNYVRGISANVTSNPFVVNMHVEKELFDRRGKISIQAFDLLNQNNFVTRDTDDNGGYVDTKSNALSRYFMVRLSMRLQKWSGMKSKNGRPITRRGDGSFN